MPIMVVLERWSGCWSSSLSVSGSNTSPISSIFVIVAYSLDSDKYFFPLYSLTKKMIRE